MKQIPAQEFVDSKRLGQLCLHIPYTKVVRVQQLAGRDEIPYVYLVERIKELKSRNSKFQIDSMTREKVNNKLERGLENMKDRGDVKDQTLLSGSRVEKILLGIVKFHDSSTISIRGGAQAQDLMRREDLFEGIYWAYERTV